MSKEQQKSTTDLTHRHHHKHLLQWRRNSLRTNNKDTTTTTLTKSTLIMVRLNLLAMALALESAVAFAPTSSTHHHGATLLNLVPEQSQLLVAYSQEYLSKKAKESSSRASMLTSSRRRSGNNPRDAPRSRGMAAAARSLVSRLVGHEDNKQTARGDTSLSASTIEEAVHNLLEDDEVRYPIVGFTLVDGHAIPTPGQQAACNLHPHSLQEVEEEYGSWSTSPQGGDSLWI